MHSDSTITQAVTEDIPQPVPVYDPETTSSCADDDASMDVHHTSPLGYWSRGTYTGVPMTEHWIAELIGGKERFPDRNPFEQLGSFSGQFQAVHPMKFDTDNFARIWTSQPLCLDTEDVTIYLEEDYHGAPYRILPNPAVIISPVARGTVIVLAGHDQLEIRYIATTCRAATEKFSLVQVNAYMEDQQLFRAENPDWPTFLLILPSHLCEVPIHPDLLPYHHKFIGKTRIIVMPLIRSWKKIRQLARSLLTPRIVNSRTTAPIIPLSRM